MHASPHPLIRFYLGEGPDSEGRFLRDIRSWDPRRLESVHDYIQWLFPLRTYSRFNPDAPILDDGIVARFRADGTLRAELLASFRQMLAFYGFDYREENGRPAIALAADAATRQRNWLKPGNHNLLRLTRILSCLSTLGLRPQAEVFLAALEGIYAQHGPGYRHPHAGLLARRRHPRQPPLSRDPPPCSPATIRSSRPKTRPTILPNPLRCCVRIAPRPTIQRRISARDAARR